ncbi:MAG: lipid-A-disaccharide synthase [Nitrospirales bacterium]
MNRKPRILILTGEASGDLHGGNLAKALQQLCPGIHITGVGGAHMLAAGVNLLPGIDRVDAIGFPGVKQLWQGMRTLQRLKNIIREEPYDAIVFIDSPGMNLRLAKVAAKAKQQVIYYIAPQIWAWGKRRLKVIQQSVSRMIVIFPFEEELYRKAGVPCSFVGHPLLDTMEPSYQRSAVRERLTLPAESRVLGLLPGSREHEVLRCLPTMLEAAWETRKAFPKLHIIIARSASVSEDIIHGMVSQYKSLQVSVVDHQSNEVMAASDLLFVASGTATLQAAVIGTPMFILYRVSWLTYVIARQVIKIPYIGLANIVAGRLIAPEFIQEEMTVKRLVPEAIRLLRDPQLLQHMRDQFQDVRAALGKPGASRRAAECVLTEVQG